MPDDWLKLAILWDETAKYSSSNKAAIDKFCEAAVKNNFYPTIIQKQHCHTNIIENYDALFIRDTTSVQPDDYTYWASTFFGITGKPALDDYHSMRHCCDKIWQYKALTTSAFYNHDFFYLPTLIPDHDTLSSLVTSHNEYPLVIKLANSSFSRGVFKVNDISMFLRLIHQLRGQPFMIQTFAPTEFDWRIGILNGQPLFACKYYMPEGEWKIIKYDRNGDFQSGNHEAIPLPLVPDIILNAAIKSASLIGKGLYGVDIKLIDHKPYVMEINDAVSIDAGVEDEAEGDVIYDKIIKYLRKP